MIITDFLDTDLSCFTQGQFGYKNYRDTIVEYAFKCRTPNFDFSSFFDYIQIEIDNLHGLKFTDSGLGSLARLNLFDETYLNFLKQLRLRPDREVQLKLCEDGSLNLRIKGEWPVVIHYETHILAIISEICQINRQPKLGAAWKNLLRKMTMLREYKRKIILFEMGTCRRQSKYWQEQVLQNLKQQKLLSGTSNIMFGTQFGIPIVGTIAHQSFQVAQSMAPQLETFIQFFLKQWMDQYPYECKTTLTDTVGYKAFLNSLNREIVLHFNGFRHDSGNPYVMGEAFIEMLAKFNVNAKSRILVFSDNLDINQKMFDLHSHFVNRIGVNIGIDENLVNDFSPFFSPLSIVVKMVTCNEKPVAKLADSDGKAMCEDQNYRKCG